MNTTCATDAKAGGVEVAFGTSASPTNRQSCGSSMGQTLAAGDGTKTVYMRWRDCLGNVTSDTTDTIILDQSAPTATTISCTNFTNGAPSNYTSTTACSL